MKVEDVQKCSFKNWYYDFEKVTVRSVILPFPDGFTRYLLKDGIVLPQSSNSFFEVESNSDDESDSEADWENSNTEEAEPPCFPEFDEQIKGAINDLGGKVFPKLNWSSPQDACWISLNGSLCSTSESDIYLLLKSSDFIIHDLTKAFKDCDDYVQNENLADSLCQPNEEYDLVLRKWIEVDTSGEFRCFVKNNNLIGISQREVSLYFDHIVANKHLIIEDILTFFKNNIQFKFSSSNYVFDVYRRKEKHVRLLDFNPFGKMTEALLFDWEELDQFSEIQDGVPEFRCIDENFGVQPRLLSYHAIPKDIVDISTCQDSFKLVDLIKLKIDEEQRTLSYSNEDQEDNTVEK